jgi:phenylacetic acid degradation operon negative regulatory protein
VRVVLGAAPAGRSDGDRSHLTGHAAAGLDLRPLTARSVILSILLGSHPPFLAVKALVRTTELFGISEGTTRVALSRLAAEGDVVAEAGAYRLSPRLVTRQQLQDQGLHPETRTWRGGWEVAVAKPDLRAASDRAALRSDMLALRLAEVRPGVWTRPGNLIRDWPEAVCERVWKFEAKTGFDGTPASEIAGSLWNLPAWAARAEALIDALGGSSNPAQRFIVAASIVRHFRDDPVLPPPLLPRAWPGTRLRRAYEAYELELGELLRRERVRQGAGRGARRPTTGA